MGRRICYPACNEKRDFMQVSPPRTEADFYREYDPNVGVGTALVLILFFIVVTIKGFVKWGIRKFRMYRFEKERAKEALVAAATVVVEET